MIGNTKLVRNIIQTELNRQAYCTDKVPKTNMRKLVYTSYDMNANTLHMKIRKALASYGLKNFSRSTNSYVRIWCTFK